MHQDCRAAVLALVAALAAACGGSGGGTPPGPTPTQIAKVAGDSQVAAAGATLTPFTVVVKDASNTPLANVTVSWAAGAGGGSIAATSTTDANGVATATRTLGAAAGTQTTTATHSGLTGSPVTFTSFSQIQGATSIQANGGTGQTDTVLSTLATPVSVIVRDYNNAPVAGVIVTWSIGSGGTGSTVSQATDTTDGSGVSSVIRKLGQTAGAQSTVATVAGLVGSPVSVTATGTAGATTQIALNGGNNQTGTINSALAVPHTVKVSDAYGNGKAGVTVTWAVGDGGGSVSSSSPVTAGTGIASVTRTLGPAVGTHTDTASVNGLTGSPVVFTATAVIAPLTASVTVGPGQVFSPDSVRIASGGTVTWTWAGANTLSHNVQWLTGPGTLPPNSATQAQGSYQASFSTPGTYTYDCIIHGTSMSGKVVVQ